MTAQTSHEVDVSRVPPFPVVRLELRQESDETWTGLVDGRKVAERVSFDESLGVVEGQAQQRARQRPSGMIRAIRTGFGLDEATDVVITSDGVVVPTTAPEEKKSLRGRWLFGAVVLLVAGGAGAVIAVAATTHHAAPKPAAAPSPAQLPVVPPPGFSAVAGWSVPVVATSSEQSSVATGSGEVFAVSSDGTALMGLDAGTGVQHWRSKFPVSSSGVTVSGGPVWVQQGSTQVVMAWTSDRIAAFDPATGHVVQSWSLPQGMSQVAAYPNGVVAGGVGQQVQLFTPSSSLQRVVPAGATVVGVGPDGTSVVAVGQGRAWQVSSPSVAGDGVALPTPKGMTLSGPMGVLGSTLVLAWAPTNETGSAWMQAVAVGDWHQQWLMKSPVSNLNASVSSGTTVATPKAVQAPNGSWAVLGPVLMDAHGKAHGLPDGWSTTAINSSMAYGRTSQGTAVAHADGTVQQTNSATVNLTGESTSVGAADDAGHSFVVASNGAGSTQLYALQPTGGK